MKAPPRRSTPRITLKLEPYFPTMMIVKEPGIAAPRPAPRPPDTGGGEPAGGGGGGGPTPDAIAKRWPVLLSKAIVRAPFEGHVSRSCSTSMAARHPLQQV